MDHYATTSSIYHRFLATYVRRPSGSLVHCTGPSQETIRSLWDSLRVHLSTYQHVSTDSNGTSYVAVPIGLDAALDTSECDVPVSQCLVALERATSKSNIIGIVLRADHATSPSSDIENFFGSLILHAIELDIHGKVDCNDKTTKFADPTEAIVNHFDTTLRYSGLQDEWDDRGRDYFRDRVYHFTSQGKRVEFCLPAFPCKSSNPNKVQGTKPDRGEYIALTNLHRFMDEIERIYEPGAKIWIISDGHVFSDCIGVDDSVVDSYGDQLIAMNEEITRQRGGRDRVGFKSLVDIFALDTLMQTSTGLDIPQIPHYIPTKMAEESELCRRILMMGFQANDNDLRNRIESGDPTVLALYRGFSKFMLEDLDQNMYTKDLSRSRRRKLSAKVAFEMIQRNQAYSNLVEVIFPHHIRLSIHAHSNSGPKFGVQLFGPNVRTTNILSPDGALMESDDLLHVPTPWHNCVVEIEGHSFVYVTKSSVVQSALSSGQFIGILASTPEEMGAYFRLTPVSRDVESIKATINDATESEDSERTTTRLRNGGLLHQTLAFMRSFAARCFGLKHV